jgi:hypothetical protein
VQAIREHREIMSTSMSASARTRIPAIGRTPMNASTSATCHAVEDRDSGCFVVRSQRLDRQGASPRRPIFDTSTSLPLARRRGAAPQKESLTIRGAHKTLTGKNSLVILPGMNLIANGILTGIVSVNMEQAS